MTAALLTLADSRLPAGGHTHSGGVEQAIARGLVTDPRSLEAFLRRRLTTAGSTAAGLAAAACRAATGPSGQARAATGPSRQPRAGTGAPGQVRVATGEPHEGRDAALRRVDQEAEARTPSPALRAASRQQGRGLVRVGRRAWPGAVWDDLPGHPHHPLALGVAAAMAGLTPADAAAAAAYLSITGPATAAQRLLAMDPITVAVVTARLAPTLDEVAAAAGPDTDGWLPAGTDPLLDLLAEVHADRGDRFFAS